MVPESEGLMELLSQGVLEHGSTLNKATTLNFDQVLQKISSSLNFSIIEKVENSAYMHAKTMKNQHSVAFLLKYHEEKRTLLVEGKSTNQNILAALTDEISDLVL